MYSAIWAYPWDFLDEGVDTVLGRVADSGLNAVSVAAAYHTFRALCPHNPMRAVYHGEGGVVYFDPDPDAFRDSRLQPVISELAEEQDPLALICDAAEKRGLKVHAWTVVTHNTRLGTRYPDCTIENAFGDRYPFGLCPANPDVRAYALGLVRSLAQRKNLDTIELESLGYMGIDHSGHHSKAGIELDPLHRFLLSVCFCSHCAERMEAHGVDVRVARDAVVRELRGCFAGQLSAPPGDPHDALPEVLGGIAADGILHARDEVVLTLLEEMYWLVREPQCLNIMVSGSPLNTGAGAGVTLSEARQWSDRMVIQAFSKDTQAIRAQVADITARRGSTPVYAGLQAITPFVNSAAELAERARVSAEAGAEGLEFCHYGLMPLANLDWVRRAVEAVTV